MTDTTSPVPPWRHNWRLHNFIYKGGGFKPSKSTLKQMEEIEKRMRTRREALRARQRIAPDE